MEGGVAGTVAVVVAQFAVLVQHFGGKVGTFLTYRVQSLGSAVHAMSATPHVGAPVVVGVDHPR